MVQDKVIRWGCIRRRHFSNVIITIYCQTRPHSTELLTSLVTEKEGEEEINRKREKQ